MQDWVRRGIRRGLDEGEGDLSLMSWQGERRAGRPGWARLSAWWVGPGPIAPPRAPRPSFKKPTTPNHATRRCPPPRPHVRPPGPSPASHARESLLREALPPLARRLPLVVRRASSLSRAPAGRPGKVFVSSAFSARSRLPHMHTLTSPPEGCWLSLPVGPRAAREQRPLPANVSSCLVSGKQTQR